MTKFPMGWDAAALDWITIDQLEFDCIIGIYPHERAQVQPVQINLRWG